MYPEGFVTGVDLLESAQKGFLENCTSEGVSRNTHFLLSEVESFPIQENFYDYIIGVSVLEHIKTEAVLKETLEKLMTGTKNGGVHYFIISTDNQLIGNNGEQDPIIEINMSYSRMEKLLREMYSQWKILKIECIPWESKQTHISDTIIQRANSLRFLVKKP